MDHLSASREDILRIYRSDDRPWVIGYSGGKDSTVVARLVFEALLTLPPDERKKPVFIVSSDTLGETPLVVEIIRETLDKMGKAALELGIPIVVGPPVTPLSDQTFWVNLIGRGYPAPTRQFRWCTERMKIDPVSEFIKSKVAAFGEVIVVLGSRSQESTSRAQVMRKHRIEGSRLARHNTLPNAFVFTPIDEWSADDVWEHLFSGPAPWGGDHQALFDLYKGSNAGECPLVIDTSTPSCGNSRFGCWTCTVVTHDRAMDGLIESGHTWMKPLRDFRNMLHDTTLPENKATYRSTKRRDGSITVLTNKATGEEKHILGPYRMEHRRKFLEQLLEIQLHIDKTNPGPSFELITKPELEAIRIQWRLDPNEPDWEDCLPTIYRKVMTDRPDLNWDVNDDFVFAGGEESLIAESCEEHGVSKELFMKLIELELSFEGYSRRSKLQEKLGELLARDWSAHEDAISRKIDQRVTVRDRDDQEAAFQARYATLMGALGDAA
jgi:DNA sulfur modification protein DndC